MSNHQEMVRKWHTVMEVPDPKAPTLEGYLYELRCKLILEEALEFVEACGLRTISESGASIERTHEPNWVKMIDALCDLLYVTYGAATAMGVDLDPMFAAVHAANMRKLGPDGRPIRREDGKILKPTGWYGPEEELARLLLEAQEHGRGENEQGENTPERSNS